MTVEPTDSTLAEGVTVSVDVSNVGDHDGAEVVQVYVNDVDPAVERPPKELKVILQCQIMMQARRSSPTGIHDGHSCK